MFKFLNNENDHNLYTLHIYTVYYALLTCKLYQSTHIGSDNFLSLFRRDKVRIGVYFLWENDEDCAGAAGTQMCNPAPGVTLLLGKGTTVF